MNIVDLKRSVALITSMAKGPMLTSVVIVGLIDILRLVGTVG